MLPLQFLGSIVAGLLCAVWGWCVGKALATARLRNSKAFWGEALCMAVFVGLCVYCGLGDWQSQLAISLASFAIVVVGGQFSMVGLSRNSDLRFLTSPSLSDMRELDFAYRCTGAVGGVLLGVAIPFQISLTHGLLADLLATIVLIVLAPPAALGVVITQITLMFMFKATLNRVFECLNTLAARIRKRVNADRPLDME